MKRFPLLHNSLKQLSMATVLVSSTLLGSTPSHAEESLIGNAVKMGDVKEIKQIIAKSPKADNSRATKSGQFNLLQT